MILTPCSFDERCGKVAGEGGMCPRHTELLKEMGLSRAIASEYGFVCEVCLGRFKEEPVVVEGYSVCERCARSA